MATATSFCLRACVPVLLAVSFSLAAHAQNVETDPAVIGRVFSDTADRYIVTSETIDDEFLIKVIQVGTWAGEELVPVVYAFEGDSRVFDLVAYTADTLTRQNAQISSMLIVGVDYVRDESLSPPERGALRFRDLTPTIDQDVLARHAIPIAPGSADDFLTFIRDELEPLILTRYPADPDDRTVVGFALGGLFALYTLFTEPDAFERYVASMPTIWWDDHVLFEYESQFAERYPNASARLFLSTGGWEGAPGRIGVTAMSERLQQRRYPNLAYTVRLFEPGVHPIYAGIAYGLRDVFQ